MKTYIFALAVILSGCTNINEGGFDFSPYYLFQQEITNRDIFDKIAIVDGKKICEITARALMKSYQMSRLYVCRPAKDSGLFNYAVAELARHFPVKQIYIH